MTRSWWIGVPALILGLGLALVVLYAALVALNRRPPELWELPDGYRGWVVAEYSRSGCPPLARRSGVLLYRVNAEGRVCTSDAFPEGEAQDRFEYVRADGYRRELRVPEEVREITFESVSDRLLIFVGTRAEQEAARNSLPSGFRIP